MAIIAVDFDGVLCEDEFPKIGKAKSFEIEACKKAKRQGHKLILWTCRRDDRLREAVEWCKTHGLEFDAVNSNLEENIKEYKGDTRKVFAHVYFDDKGVASLKDFESVLCTLK